MGNGVDSFLVVVGDTLPEVDHWANHYEIVEHLLALQERMPAFEVGMTTRFRSWQFRRRVELGAQFFVAGPVLDPDTVESSMRRLAIEEGDPPVFVGVVPPFSPSWISRLESHGAVQATLALKEKIASLPNGERRRGGMASRRRDDRALPSGRGGRCGADDPQVLHAGRRGRYRLGR